MKIYDETKNLNILHEPIFFGSGKNLQRYDIMKYPYFYDLAEKMDENFWKPSEISLLKDNSDYKDLTDSEKRIFTFNLKRQIVLDSIQGRSALMTFGRVCTNSAFEVAMTRLQFQEINHSDTYSYILRNVFDNPSEIFDTIINDGVITKHTKNITEAYENFYDALNHWEVLPDNDPNKPTLHEMKKYLWLALIAWNILEGIRFFVSFACTFAFAENKKMIGNAQELKLIARDEILHLQMTQKLINILKENEEEGFLEVIKESEDEVQEMFREATLNEIEWAKYLFEEGSIIGLNAEILTQYMKYITNSRLRALKMPKMFTEITQNPLPWMDQWLGQSREEVLPQEIEITEYKIGAVKDIEDKDWGQIFE
jgi:ribonucleoside-diphosphate reductase beta chain